MGQIPHLNALTEKFEKRGLTIIGVTDEPANKISSFIESKGIKYLIAIGGGSGYQTTGIPHSWLVSPEGDIVWDGHPGGLKEDMIEEHLRRVRARPVYELSKDLKKAEALLNGGKYSSGIKALEAYLKKPKNDEVAAEARETIQKVNDYGKDRLAQAKKLGEEGYYAAAMKILETLEADFKGLDAGSQAKSERDAWKKDAKVKVEIEASALLEQAESLIRDKKLQAALPILQKLKKQSKYEGTKARARAEEKLKSLI